MSLDYLRRELARLDNARHQLQVLCFGDHRETGLNFAVTGIAGMPELMEAIAHEMRIEVERSRAGTLTISSGFPRWFPWNKIIVLYTHAALFVCPSFYEPFGIINLEAMAAASRWLRRPWVASPKW